MVLDIASLVAGADHLGILLSGGLDSRLILASICAAKQRGLIDCRLSVFTWGAAESRDVRLARSLTPRDTSFTSFELADVRVPTAVDLARRGSLAAVSPVHFHRMDAFQQYAGAKGPLVIAGTFGNALPRGEYFDRHISREKEAVVKDWALLLRPDIRSEFVGAVRDSLEVEGENRLPGLFTDYEYRAFGRYYYGHLAQAFSRLEEYVPVVQAYLTPQVVNLLSQLPSEFRCNELSIAAIEYLGWPVFRDDLRPPCRRLRSARDERTHHRYPLWIARRLKPGGDLHVADEWIEGTGLLSVRGYRRAVHYVASSSRPYPPLAYVLAHLRTLELGTTTPERGPAAPTCDPALPRLRRYRAPWGVPGRGN
jgi:hypothetical protein